MRTEKINTLRNAIVEVEKRIRENESAREKATAIVADRTEEIAAIKTATPQDIAGKIARQREDLAAAIVLGEKSQADLDAFEKEAALALKKQDREAARLETIKPIETVIAGLKRKIAALEVEGKALVAERDRLWGNYIRELAEEAGAEYRAHAEKAFGSLTRVFNLGGILHRLENHPNGIGAGAREFAIPSLGTESTALPPEKQTSVGIDTNLFSINSDENLRKHVNSREGEIFEEFEKAGLKWPGPPSTSMPTPIRAHAPGLGEGIAVSIMRPAEPLRGTDGCALPVEAVTDFDPFTGTVE